MNKTLTEKTRGKILAHLRGYDALRELWPELAVYMSGSFGAGVADEHSDVDIERIKRQKAKIEGEVIGTA